MSAVKAPPFDPADFALRFETAAVKAGFRPELMGTVEGWPLKAFTKRTPGPRPRIYLSGGMHGDEPAPPLTLLSMVEDGLFDGRAVWFLCPMLNPTGLVRGVRENSAGVDLNRDYRSLVSPEIRAHVGWLQRQPNFDVALSVHEDWESKGFYLYELNPDSRPSLAETMIGAAREVCPIDLSPLIDGREAKGGILRPVADPEARELWPESIYLRAHHTRLAYTIETPSSFPPKQREEALRAALGAAIASLVSGWEPMAAAKSG